MDQLQKILLHILVIIDFQDDKQDFIEQITQICLGKTILAVTKDISSDKQQAFQSMSGLEDKSIEEQMISMTQVLGLEKEVVQKKFLEICKDTLHEYIEAIIPTLSESQKIKLQDYLQTVSLISSQ